MKKCLCSALIFLSLIFSHICNAQGNEAPKREDAVNFIQKIYTDYTEANRVEWHLDTVAVKLTNCILTLKFVLNKSHKYIIKLDVSRLMVYNFQVRGVHGGFVPITKIIASLATRPVWIYNSLDRDHPNGKYVSEFLPLDLDEYRTESEFDRAMDDAYKTNNDYTFSPVSINKNVTFKDNNYEKRLCNAFDFLIKSCGGGKPKIDPTEKF